MKCKKINDLFFDYLDGQLAGREKAELERHLQTCPACHARLQDIVKINGLLQTATAPVPAPDFSGAWSRISAAVGVEPRRRFAPLPTPRWALLAAGFLAFFILGVAMARIVFFRTATDAAAPAAAPFLYSARDYFAALQPVLMEFSNDPGAEHGGTAGQAKIRPLLNNLRLLRLQADRDRDASLSGLLDEIELVLLELAHLDRSDPENARQVNTLLQEKGIAMKMKVFKFTNRKSVRI